MWVILHWLMHDAFSWLRPSNSCPYKPQKYWYCKILQNILPFHISHKNFCTPDEADYGVVHWIWKTCWSVPKTLKTLLRLIFSIVTLISVLYHGGTPMHPHFDYSKSIYCGNLPSKKVVWKTHTWTLLFFGPTNVYTYLVKPSSPTSSSSLLTTILSLSHRHSYIQDDSAVLRFLQK